MVCVEVDEETEDERIVTVVVGNDDDDITLARDADRQVLVYGETMERVAASEPAAAAAISLADGQWLYADPGDEMDPDDEDGADGDDEYEHEYEYEYEWLDLDSVQPAEVWEPYKR